MRRPFPQRAGIVLAALVLGPIGTIGLSLMRIAQHAPSVRPPSDVPRRSRRSVRRASGGIQRIFAWVRDVQLDLLRLVLAGGFAWIVYEAATIVVATMRARAALTPLLHG